MHIEILTEDSSTRVLLENILPSLCEERFTYRIISYRGVGKIPGNLKSNQDPSKRILLQQLPRIVKGYDKTPGIDEVIVVLDADSRPCVDFLAELKSMISNLDIKIPVVFRLAIEEVEAWLLADKDAIKKAYPSARLQHLLTYKQDEVCGTWEKLADAIYPGGSSVVKNAGWPLPGQLKNEWAKKIGPHLNTANNQSPSFQKLRTYLLKVGSQFGASSIGS